MAHALCLPFAAKLYVNSYFTLLLEKIEEYGGDVIKFAGDALLVMWSQEDTVTEGGKEADPEAVLQQLSLQAAQCAIALQVTPSTLACCSICEEIASLTRCWLVSRWLFCLSCLQHEVGEYVVELGLDRIAAAEDSHDPHRPDNQHAWADVPTPRQGRLVSVSKSSCGFRFSSP